MSNSSLYFQDDGDGMDTIIMKEEELVIKIYRNLDPK